MINIVLIILTMLTTDATTSLMCGVILCIFGVLFKINKYNFLTKNSKIYIIVGEILSIIVVLTAFINNMYFHNFIKFLDFSGRGYVWRDAIFKIIKRPIFGYGIEGILLDVFWNKWNNSAGFNYAHNQNLQNFLDGGVVTFIFFYCMMISFFKNVNKISDCTYKAIINCCLICFILVMIFESTSLYCYMYMYLAIIYSLPKVISYKKKRNH